LGEGENQGAGGLPPSCSTATGMVMVSPGIT
jgi:hypothetical protein